MGDVLVLGVGNILMSDEGAGVRAAELLRHRVPEEVRVLEAGALGPELLPDVEAASRLLILDCIDAGRAAGSVLRVDGTHLRDPATQKLSPHEFALAELLTLAAFHATALEEVVVLGVQPALVVPGLELSPEVAAALPRLVEVALGVLEGWTGQGRTLPGGGAERPNPDL